MKVTVHTKPNCQPCRLTKQRFDKKGVEYTEVELTPESAERFRDEDLLTAPVIEVDLGDGATWRWAGLKPDHIARLVELSAA